MKRFLCLFLCLLLVGLSGCSLFDPDHRVGDIPLEIMIFTESPDADGTSWDFQSYCVSQGDRISVGGPGDLTLRVTDADSQSVTFKTNTDLSPGKDMENAGSCFVLEAGTPLTLYYSPECRYEFDIPLEY